MMRCFKKLKCLKICYGANSADFAAGWQHIAHLLLKIHHHVTRKINFTDPDDQEKNIPWTAIYSFLQIQPNSGTRTRVYAPHIRQLLDKKEKYHAKVLSFYLLQSCLSQVLTSILPEIFRTIQKSVLQSMSFSIKCNFC